MLVDDVSRWSVLAFASVHVLGLLTRHPVPWSASLAAVSLLAVAGAATARAATGTLRSLALLSGLAAAAGLVALVELRGGGAGWPFFLTEAPTDDRAASAEAALLTAAVLGLSAAALLPEHGAEDRLRALRDRLVARMRGWYTVRRTRTFDLPEPPPAPEAATAGPVVLDLGVLTPRAPAPADPPRRGAARARRGAAWWRPRLAAAGVVAVTALVVAAATMPMWQPDSYGQTPFVASRDRAGMLLATVPVLLAVIAATVAACLHLRRSGGRGVALAAVTFVALAVPVAWARGCEYRFSPQPPASAPVLYLSVVIESDSAHAAAVLVHPGDRWRAGTQEPQGPAGWTDGSWWSEPFDWDEAGDGVVAGLAVVVFLALTTALLPLPRRPELLP